MNKLSKTCVISLMASYVIKINSRIKCIFLTTKCNVEGINKPQTDVKATQLQHNYFVLCLWKMRALCFGEIWLISSVSVPGLHRK